jgi:hypothetical protein
VGKTISSSIDRIVLRGRSSIEFGAWSKVLADVSFERNTLSIEAVFIAKPPENLFMGRSTQIDR